MLVHASQTMLKLMETRRSNFLSQESLHLFTDAKMLIPLHRGRALQSMFHE